MEKMFTDDLTKTVILLSLIMAGTSILMVKLISVITKIQGSFKPYQKGLINYLLVALLLFSVIACLAYWSYLGNQQFLYLIFQAYFLFLGVVHLYWMKEYLRWAGNSKAMWAELIFTLITAVVGSIGFFIVFQFLSPYDLGISMATSTLFFIIPWFVKQTFVKAISIPPRILKEWFYPVREEIEEPDEDKLKNLLIISFVIQKQITDVHETNFRAKAPVDMEMGQLFYYFINDYNERHPQDKIEYIDGAGEPYGWVFYQKPQFFDLQKRYINAGNTIFLNGIKENNVIICSRSLN